MYGSNPSPITYQYITYKGTFMIETVEFRTPSARCRALQDAPTPPLPVAVPPTCNFWIVICETYSKRFCLGNQPLENQRWILAHFLEGYWKLAGWLAGCWKLAARRRREKKSRPVQRTGGGRAPSHKIYSDVPCSESSHRTHLYNLHPTHNLKISGSVHSIQPSSIQPSSGWLPDTYTS